MKSIEIIVPRKLITEFYPHPELYGDFIVELKNGMITDVYYNEERDFITITGEEDLVDYLNHQETTPTTNQNSTRRSWQEEEVLRQSDGLYRNGRERPRYRQVIS